MNGRTLDTSPRFPEDPIDRAGVAILGCGTIAQSAHLPAYEQHGVGVTGVWSRSPGTTRDVGARFANVGRVYDSAEELLADPEVRIVDIATGPQGRLAWIESAIEAGKHVLAQKPLTLDRSELARLPHVLTRAAQADLRVAVNHNGRWAPPWRATTQLLRGGAIGPVTGVTHLHDKPLPPLVGTPFDDVPHMLITDYLLHWIDITRTWLADGGAGPVVSVHALDTRVPGQPDDARNPWSATVTLSTAVGATGTLRITGSNVATDPGCPFWVHGTTGTIRGSVLLDSDRLELDDGEACTSFRLRGAWFVDGFAAAMGELMCAVTENREPENSAADATLSIELALAARDSADLGGIPVQAPA